MQLKKPFQMKLFSKYNCVRMKALVIAGIICATFHACSMGFMGYPRPNEPSSSVPETYDSQQCEPPIRDLWPDLVNAIQNNLDVVKECKSALNFDSFEYAEFPNVNIFSSEKNGLPTPESPMSPVRCVFGTFHGKQQMFVI